MATTATIANTKMVITVNWTDIELEFELLAAHNQHNTSHKKLWPYVIEPSLVYKVLTFSAPREMILGLNLLQ